MVTRDSRTTTRRSTVRLMNFGVFHSICLVLLVTLLVSAGAGAAYAQDDPAGVATPSRLMTVGVYLSPPFVMKEGDRYTGMAIDLWEQLSSELDLQSEYVELDTYSALVDATADGEVDVAVTNLTITRSRVERIDFTQPWFDAGLRIMVRREQGSSFRELVVGLRESGHLKAYAWIAFVIVIATALLTVFDRRFDKNFPRRWRDGAAESFYTVMSVTTSGKMPSRKNLFGWIGRIWQGMWLVCGIAVLAYVTSSVTSVMTTLSLTNQINSVADLPGRPVGVQTGSVAEEYAGDVGLDTHSYAHIEDAVEALLEGRITAIIGDAPVLEYHAHVNPAQPVSVVGPIFRPDKYGFGLSQHNELTRPLTVEVISARRGGLAEELRARYFGDLY